MRNGRLGYAGMCFSVRKSASEYGLSSDTCGRLKDGTPGDSTAWYTSFWEFCAAYLRGRFENNWCLSPEQSIFLHTGNQTVPKQLLVRSPKGGNKPIALPFGTSLFDVRYTMPKKDDIVEKDGLRLYTVPAALVVCPELFGMRGETTSPIRS